MEVNLPFAWTFSLLFRCINYLQRFSMTKNPLRLQQGVKRSITKSVGHKLYARGDIFIEASAKLQSLAIVERTFDRLVFRFKNPHWNEFCEEISEQLLLETLVRQASNCQYLLIIEVGDFIFMWLSGSTSRSIFRRLFNSL